MENKSTTYILYCYTERPAAKDNLEYFLNKGGYEDDPKLSYTFIINGHDLSVKIPDNSNVKILKRPNTGLDFGAWSYALNELKLILGSEDRIILLNDTIRGPFFPWFNKSKWYEIFGNMITDKVKLAGLTINCHLKMNGVDYSEIEKYWKHNTLPHIQSMLLVFDKIGLEIAQANGILVGKEYTDTWQIVVQNELKLSLVILLMGYNINVIAKKYNYKNYLDKNNYNLNSNYCNGDPWYNGSYFGGNLHPYETIFFKTNRDVNSETLKILSEY